MQYYRLVLRESAAPGVLMGTKEYICTEEQRERLEELWHLAEERSEIDIYPWERRFTAAKVLGTSSVHKDSFYYDHYNVWDHAYHLGMNTLDAEFVYVATREGTVERYVQVRMQDLKLNGNLLFSNTHTAAIAGDRDMICLKNTQTDSEHRIHFANIVANAVYHYEMAFPDEAAALADMDTPCAMNLRTFFDEIFGDA